MAEDSSQPSDRPTIDRRRLMQAAGATAATGLAGCFGGGGDGGGGGERVPTVAVEYWSNLGGISKVMEDASPIIKKNLENRLGLSIEIKPVEFTTQINNTIDDKRTFNLGFWYHTNTPDRLDPHEMTRRYSADWAGGNGQANPVNYADCNYTYNAANQASATSESERNELVTKAHAKMSEDLGTLPLMPNLLYGAVRTDEVNLKGVGKAGIARTNPHFYLQSEAKNKDQLSAVDTPVLMETTNYPIIDSSAAQAIWNHLVNSTLTEYDQNLKLQNVLAKSYETANNGKKITVELKDATFHNGDPITAEDVKFTYEQLANNPGAYPQASSPPYDSINVIDEKTTEFNFTRPFLPLISKVWPRWGIMHKQTWEEGGAPESPEEFSMDPIVGSGPFKVRDFSSGEHMDMTPHDGHPVHSPGYDLFLRAFRNNQTAFQAFKANEVQFAPNMSPGIIGRIEDQMGDTAATKVTQGFMPYILYPQYQFAPTRFREFRQAVGAALDRKQINAVAMRGDSSPQLYSCPLQPAHPFRPDEGELTQMVSEPAGNEDKARQALKDAGWGWDDSDNLRYPADKNLEPRWPKGETPSPDEFPCINQDGGYKQDYQPS